MFNKLRKMAVVAVTAGALVLTGGIAQADNGKAPDSVIDASKKGNIHLVKYDDEGKAGSPANGIKLDSSPRQKTIQGIEFSLSQVTKFPISSKFGTFSGKPIDITDVAQLTALAKLSASDVTQDMLTPSKTPENATPGANGSFKTGNKGEIDWKDLKLGVYILRETNSTVGEVTYKAAPDSLIFLPTTNPENQTEWLVDTDGNYGIWIYPKNSKDENTKFVDDAKSNVGDTITYTIEASIPATKVLDLKDQKDGLETNLNEFAFFDHLDEKLELTTNSRVFLSTAISKEKALSSFKSNTTSLVQDSDYKVTIKGQKLFVAFDVPGLNKLGKAKAADNQNELKAYLIFQPTVKKSGIIPNKAIVFKNNGSGKGDITKNPTTPPSEPGKGAKTKTVVSAWGKIEIVKKDDTGKPLPDAVFQVYGVTEDGIDYKTPVKVGNTNKWTTAKDTGKVVIDGLHANNLEDSEAKDATYKKYALVEIEAPAGFELNPKPIFFTIDASNVQKITTESTWKLDEEGKVIPESETTKTTVEESASSITDNIQTLFRTVDVINIKSKPKLPLTGGAGITIFGLLGAAIIGGGIFAAKRNSKKA